MGHSLSVSRSSMSSLIKTCQLTKLYRIGDTIVPALQGIDLSINQGEFVAIMGASGSGKSTLMNLLGCLDVPTSGEYFLDGRATSTLSSHECATIRNKKIGFVFQAFNLLPRTSALDNVLLPLVYDRTGQCDNPGQAAMKALERVGLKDRLRHEPGKLSGGEQQRVAIARALVNDPAILLADEPTGNLDSKTSAAIMVLFRELNGDGITVIVVTHNPEIAAFARRIVHMRDGLLFRDEHVTGPPGREGATESHGAA